MRNTGEVLLYSNSGAEDLEAGFGFIFPGVLNESMLDDASFTIDTSEYINDDYY